MRVWMLAELRCVPGTGTAELVAWLREEGAAALRAAGGEIWGLWAGGPGIGFDSDVHLLGTAWPDDAAAGAAVELLKSSTRILEVRGTPAHPTLRPVDATPCPADGVWVFRDFDVPRADVERFVELSGAAWESFEARFDARIAGLFRTPDVDDETATLMLVTRYADYATWEASRSEAADPDAWARFRERRALTRRTRARAAAPVAL
jgi:hypothetical protein